MPSYIVAVIRRFVVYSRTELVRAVIAWVGASLLFAAPPAWSANHVYFAGFALAGDASETKEAFPITSRLLQERTARGISPLEQALWTQIQTASHPHLSLDRGLATGDYSADSVAMAFVLDWENIGRERIADSTRLIVDLHGQVLVFDFSTKKVIGSYPVAVQLLHTVDGESSTAIETALVRQLYFGGQGDTLLQQVAERLATISLQPSTGNYLRVVSVTLEDKARHTLAALGQEPAVLKARVADTFGKRLSENHQVAYVPYSKGTAIGAKMAARFANGDIYQFELPTPDYRVHLRVRGFKKVLLDSNRVESAWAYGSYLHVAIKDYEDRKAYLDAPFKFGAIKKVIAGTSYDDWSAYQESLFTLIDQITLQTIHPDQAWVDKWSAGQPVMQQLNELKRIIERSR